jgi:hypothetical protein
MPVGGHGDRILDDKSEVATIASSRYRFGSIPPSAS